jgi:hypothetical protein
MTRLFTFLAFAALTFLSARSTSLYAAEAPKPDADGFISLFDGKTLDGWRAGEHPESFRVEDGILVVSGERGHLFYDGPVGDHDFKNFELKLDVRTQPNSNSGVYFHTRFQKEGWPSKGYECQVNNTYAKDPIKTGSLYHVEDRDKTKAKDGEWFEYHITVNGKQITLKVNGETTVDHTQPDKPERRPGEEGRILSSGTIALQAHDPDSTVHYRKIRIKVLPK